MKLVKHTFKITGLGALLTHNPGSMTRGETSMKAKKIPSAEDEAAAGLYVNTNGTYYIPSIGFRSGLLYAVAGKKVGKRTAKAIVSAAVFNATEKTTLLDAKTGKPIAEYEIDTRRAMIGRAGILRSRPRFEDWAAMLELEIDEDMLPASVVEENLCEAGVMAGIGDYRVQKGGPFGRYTAELVK